MQAHVQVDSNLARVFCLEAEAINNISLSLLVNEFCADELLQFVYANGSSKEEGVDLRVETSTRSPRLNLNLVVSWVRWEAYKAVAFDSMAPPRVY